MICQLIAIYDRFCVSLKQCGDDWMMGLIARLGFSSVVLLFFWNSALTKLGTGFPGVLQPGIGAYAQILPPIAQSTGYDLSQIAFFPWGLIVYAGTYAEILLPLAILLGVFTRLASVAMIGFIVVMSIVDVVFHDLDEKTIGFLFDRMSDGIIFDQRLLWVLPLIYLVFYGAGRVSLDHILRQKFISKHESTPL